MLAKRFHRLIIASNFDSGNIEVVDCSSPTDVQLKMRQETFTEYDQKAHSQWFHFSVSNCKGTPLCLKIVNAGKASYAPAYKGYWAFTSYDRVNWTRTKTSYDGEVMQIDVTPEQNMLWVAYFPPYSYEQHMKLIGFASTHEHCNYESIGQSVQGRSMDLLTAGTGDLKLWIIARQHPGETQAEWFMDGFIRELLSDKGASLREKATLYMIPNMNPDGSVMGHLRTNAVGANLNREWCDTPEKKYKAPTSERSPEVLCTLAKMEEIGMDYFMDVHGDEELPCNFLAGEFGISSWKEKKRYIYQRSVQIACEKAPSLFQTALGYGCDEAGTGLKAIAGATISDKFDVCGTTLEMAYKNLQYPQPQKFDHESCKELGVRFVGVMEDISDLLKKLPDTYPEFEPWATCGYKIPAWEEPSYA